MMQCWIDGELPASEDELYRCLGIKVDLTTNIMHFFEIQDNGLICPSLERYRTKLANITKRKADGARMTNEKRRKLNESIDSNVIHIKKEKV